MRERGEEGEWVRVERRNRHAERPPVRQKYFRRCVSRIGAAHRLDGADEHDKSKVVLRKEGQTVKTFLVRNFPPDCTTGEHIFKYQEVGMVVDLYCPKKRDVKGKRFSFVRLLLENEVHEQDLLEKLNSIWIDSFKLRAFIPHFERKEGKKYGARREAKRDESEGKTVQQNLKAEDTGAQRPPLTNIAGFGRMYAQAASGCKGLNSEKQAHVNWRTTYIPDAEEAGWLENAKVGRLKDVLSWDDNSVEIKEEVRDWLEVKFLGESLLLILPKVDVESKLFKGEKK